MIWFTATPPPGWLICNGSTFSSTDYPALFSWLGTNVLPDMRDRFPIGVSGTKTVKSTGGNSSITQTVAQMPSHNHNISVDNTTLLYPNTGNVASIIYPVVNGAVTTFTGGGQPMNILNPYFAVNFIIYAGAVAA
jgi:microcystin-dependent protein